MERQVSIRVKGRVQGVFFRMYTVDKAQEMGLYGYVQNLRNGDVGIIVRGADSQINVFIKWCHTGSPLSKVLAVEVQDSTEVIDIDNFEIRR